MRVKVKDTWYDGQICIELTAFDKKNIADMAPDATLYAQFPDDSKLSDHDRRVWMVLGTNRESDYIVELLQAIRNKEAPSMRLEIPEETPFGLRIVVVPAGTVIESADGQQSGTVDDQNAIRKAGALYCTQAVWDHAQAVIDNMNAVPAGGTA
jgi:hypothetical protein